MKIALSFCKHCEELNERNIRETNTNLTTTQSFKFQNYCDNESISTILEALKCIHSDLQFWLNKWKSYVIVDWCARCETTVQTHCTDVTNIIRKSNRALQQSKYLTHLITIAIMSEFLLFLQRWNVFILLYNFD